MTAAASRTDRADRAARFRPDGPHAGGGIVLNQASNIPPADLVAFTTSLFTAAGLGAAAAARVAEALVEADLQGKGSHGVLQAEAYLDRLIAGSISTAEEIGIIRDGGTTVVVDARQMLGHLAAEQAMRLAVARAHEHGLALVAMRNGFHFGVAGRYAGMAAAAGCVGIVMCNTRPTMPAPGGVEKLTGTNPLAIALPTAEEPAIVLDIATSAGSVGRIRQALAAGRDIPDGWALAADGVPTNDPAEALNGFLQPAGGPKGFGLSLVIDLLCGTLAGGGWGPTLGEMRGDLTRPYNGSSLFFAIDVEAFRPLADVAAEVQAGADRVRKSKPAPGTERIYTPGERAWDKQRQATGIRIEASVLAALDGMADRLGVDRLVS